MVDTTWLTTINLIAGAIQMLCIVFYFRIPQPTRNEYSLLGIILILVFLLDTAGFIGGYLMRINMNLPYSLGSIVTGVLWLRFFGTKLPARPFGVVIRILIVLFTLFSVVNLLYIQGLWAINSNILSASGVLKLMLALCFFYILIRDLPVDSIVSLPMFWINSAVLILSAGSILINLSTDYLVNVLNDYIDAFIFHNFIVLVQLVLIAIGLSLCARPSRSNTTAG